MARIDILCGEISHFIIFREVRFTSTTLISISFSNKQLIKTKIGLIFNKYFSLVECSHQWENSPNLNQRKAFWADWNYAKLHLQIMINLYLPGERFSIHSGQVTVYHSVSVILTAVLPVFIWSTKCSVICVTQIF